MTLTVQHDESHDQSPAAVRPSSPARDRATRSVGSIAKLLAERPDLRGVHAPADLADETLRWSA